MRSLIFLLELVCVVVAVLLGVQLLVMDNNFADAAAKVVGWGAVIMFIAGAWCLHWVLLTASGYVPEGDNFYGDES